MTPVAVLLPCLVLACLASVCGGEDGSDRPRLREFAFASRAQDRRKGGGGPCVDGGDAQLWCDRGVQLLADGDAVSALRCLKLAVRLGCSSAHVFQDMSVARLAIEDLAGALEDSRRAIRQAGCSPAVVTASTGTRPCLCTSPELLLNHASLLDKAVPSHKTLALIQQVLRRYVSLACSKDSSGALSCTARGAISAIVELWRLGQLSFGNWETFLQDKWLLTAAVDADIQRCHADAVGERFSVVQPWEVCARSYWCSSHRDV